MSDKNENLIELVGGPWYSLPELADALHVHESTLKRWAQAKLIGHVRMGKLYRFSQAHIDEFLGRIHQDAERSRRGEEPSTFGAAAAALSRPTVPHRDEVGA